MYVHHKWHFTCTYTICNLTHTYTIMHMLQTPWCTTRILSMCSAGQTVCLASIQQCSTSTHPWWSAYPYNRLGKKWHAAWGIISLWALYTECGAEHFERKQTTYFYLFGPNMCVNRFIYWVFVCFIVSNRYTPPVSTVLKNAWIQYIAFFAVVSFLLFRLNSFVFRHKVSKLYIVCSTLNSLPSII